MEGSTQMLLRARLATGMRVWDIEAQKVAASFKEHLSQCVCISAQRVAAGNYVVSGSLDTNVKVWDLRSKRSIMTLKSHAKPITSVDISVDGRVVASGSHDSYVKIWENSSARCVFQLRQNSSTAAVTSLALNPKDMTIASGHSDRFLRYWDLDQGQLISVSNPPDTTPAQKVWFTDDGRFTFAGTMDSVKVWDLEKAQSGVIDIIMKPQSFYVVEFTSVNSSVIISQIQMSEINTKGGQLSQQAIDQSIGASDDITQSTDSVKQHDFYNNKQTIGGPHARMAAGLQKQATQQNRMQRGQSQGPGGQNPIAQYQSAQQPLGHQPQATSNFAKNGLNILKKNTNQNFYKPPANILETPSITQQHSIEHSARQLQKEPSQQFKDSLEDFNTLLNKNKSNQQPSTSMLNFNPTQDVNDSLLTESPPRKSRAQLVQSQVSLSAIQEAPQSAEQRMRLTNTTNLSSLYEIPIDKPLNIDLGKFLQPKEDLRYQNGNDIEIINEAMKQHPLIDNIMTRRQRNMRTVMKWWHQGNISSTINALTQMNDLSVLNDFLSDTFAQNQRLEVLTIENAPAVIGHCLTLINSKYESHTVTGVKTCGNIFNVFRDRIMQAKSVIVNERFVDLERETRLQKFDMLIDQFEKALAAPGWDRALKSTNQELREKASQIDNDIDYFIEKCRKGPTPNPPKPDFAASGLAAGGYNQKHDQI
ncbi:hypothetical protein FGO68_gene14301 [Halteria grandinella]|uniref:Katanin p80 subunit C-terminal domain-containing protein n=1 Tax=Halteria grandinella TaxID=5974 RepID=A0A8J8T6N9_HALGN|nr:hypothetical protein FGO68_gene14301 [Halteria grandinella]